MLRSSLLVSLLALLSVGTHADVYMHNPRGSNNRLNEKSANRQNADRLFDSQNNNRGGYNVGDRSYKAFDTSATTTAGAAYGALPPSALYDTTTAPLATTLAQYQMVYYEKSELSFEWTNQHGCGGNEATDPQKLNCDIILQYMCQTTDGTQKTSGDLQAPAAGVIAGAEVLRDGAVTDTPGTMGAIDNYQQITNNLNKGHHESERYYFECKTRTRNMGLFTADQHLSGPTALYTRQNPNGNQRGLECPEERDYYPYWSPSPWKDIAILTDHVGQFCTADGFYNGKSQNNNLVYKCMPAAGATNEQAVAAIEAITMEKCASKGGVWTSFTHNLPAPKCEQVPWSRVNHLGNGVNGQPLMYNWTLPTIDEIIGTTGTTTGTNVHTFTGTGGAQFVKCVVRLRYNISTDDYNPWNTTASSNQNQEAGVISPVTQNPVVDIGAGYEGVRLAVNTAQFGRTFQDRSHTFYIRSRPTNVPLTSAAKIYNLNVRGKRGNIVQTFPSVEYDFMPSRLQIQSTDFVHVQWTGSNTHNNGDPAGDGQAGDAGEGTGGTDRHNIAQLMNFNENYPQPLDKFPDNMWTRSQCFNLAGSPLTVPVTGFGDFSANAGALDCAIYMTTSGQFASATAVTNAAGTTNTFDPLLDTAPASLVGGVLMQFQGTTGAPPKSYDYMCTRNNNFSNRGQKGTIIVLNP